MYKSMKTMIFLIFLMKSLKLTKTAIIWTKYSENSDIVKYYYNLK